MDEPDFDDLIEDYMEDAFEEPPEEAYDEAVFAELATEEGRETTTEQATAESIVKTMGTPASPISTNFRSRLTATSSPDDAAAASPAAALQSPAQVREELTRTRAQTGAAEQDIYSFERYKANKTWRGDAKASPTTMRAREWKSSQTKKNKQQLTKGHSTKRLATTPEAQLLQFQSDRRTTPTIRIGRNDPNMSLHPWQGHSQFPMTLGDGSRVFVKTESVVNTAAKSRTSPNSSSRAFSLGISMTDLIRRVQAMQRKKEHDKLKALSKEMKQQTQKAKENAKSTLEDDDDEDMEEELEEETKEETESNNHETDGQLWVDKHAPATFANLLSDERTNREVLRALREWDPYVFHRNPPPRPKFAWQNPQEEDESNNPKKNPNDKRPEEKRRVILLSGPPGVGKTTLAHIVAKHCGYRPMEVNGSDERSAAVLTDRVVRAMESSTLDMHATNQKNWRGRPNCLILDEIDGADASKALQSLVELIRQEMNTSKDGKRSKPYLKRPIIFICNNLYAPALRPLLPFARRFQVGAPSPPRLVARLRSVLSSEGLSLWGGATLLNELVTATGGDIRSCLYTLQFAAAEVHQRETKDVDISHALVSALNGNGMKDDRSDVAGTAMTVFRKAKNKGRNDKLWGTKQLEDPRSSVERVLDAVESFGDNAKILDCLYLNLLNVSYIDPTFDRCAAALEWLSGADLRSIQQYYVPCASAALHLLCRVEQKPDLTYTTRALSDAHYQTEANKGLTLKFAEGFSAQVRSSRCTDVIVQETVPYALWMLSAGEGSSALVRPASSVEILNKSEKQAFQSHTATLCTLGLTYVAATEDDQVAGRFSPKNRGTQTINMVLEPPIDRLVQFQQLSVRPSDRRKEIPPAMKELLARSSVLEGIRGAHTANDRQAQKKPFMDKQLGNKRPLPTKENTATKTTDKTETTDAKSPVSTLKQDEGKKRSEEEKEQGISDSFPPVKKQKTDAPVTQNFLGIGAKRAKAARSKKRAKNVGFIPSKGAKLSNTGSNVPFQQVLRLKYIKGFTQAVRNPCRLDDLA